jgi:hypothetical protein
MILVNRENPALNGVDYDKAMSIKQRTDGGRTDGNRNPPSGSATCATAALQVRQDGKECS